MKRETKRGGKRPSAGQKVIPPKARADRDDTTAQRAGDMVQVLRGVVEAKLAKAKIPAHLRADLDLLLLAVAQPHCFDLVAWKGTPWPDVVDRVRPGPMGEIEAQALHFCHLFAADPREFIRVLDIIEKTVRAACQATRYRAFLLYRRRHDSMKAHAVALELNETASGLATKHPALFPRLAITAKDVEHARRIRRESLV